MKQIYETLSGRGCRRFGCVCAAAAVSTAVLFSGCDKSSEQKVQKQEKQTKGTQTQTPVKLTVWGAEEDQELIGQLMESFQNEYKDEANFSLPTAYRANRTVKMRCLAIWSKQRTCLRLQMTSFTRWLRQERLTPSKTRIRYGQSILRRLWRRRR